MKYKMTKKQLQAIKSLIDNLLQYSKKGYGKISNLSTMVNFQMPNSIIVKYEKEFNSSGEMGYEFVILSFDADGKSTQLNEGFKTMFDRYNFISECKTFDIEDSKQYQIVD